MKATLDQKRNVLVIELPVNTPPTPSSSGKTLLVATTAGNKETEIEINGKALYIGCNAYIHATDKPKKS